MRARKLLVPEVVQTSQMDCGPASLKSLLEGFGIPVSYGRLREACQTDVDGTSIDTMEDVARQLGLDAEQVMVPVDHVLEPEAKLLPAIIVTRHSSGVTHFVVLWRSAGGLVELMDPGLGRRWVTAGRFLEEVHVHSTPVPATGWREWAGSDAFLCTLRKRLGGIGVAANDLIASALSDPEWRSLAALDAATRAADSMVRAGGVRRGRQARQVLERFCARDQMIPACYWSVRPHAGADLMLRGAVLVTVRGRLPESERSEKPLSAELAAALEQPAARPGLELLKLLWADGLLAPAALGIAMLLAAGSVMVEAVLFRGLFDLGRELGLAGQRMAAVAALIGFLAVLTLLELPLAQGLSRMGRRLETRLRLAFLEKIPRLGDRYFQSRLKSDMAERSHSIYRIRNLPGLGGHLLRTVFELALTTLGIAWLDRASAPLALLVAGVSLALPLLLQPLTIERDLRVRSHSGALSRFYLDALLGLVPIRAHGAERAIRREHGNLLTEWARAAFGLQRAVVWVEAL
jgi:ATP-binding cassette subfamily B protein